MLGHVHGEAELLPRRHQHTVLLRDAADEGDLTIEPDPLEHSVGPVRQGIVNSAQNILDPHALRDVVDDLGLGEDGADARDRLRLLRPPGERPDVLHRHLEVLGGALEEAAGARRALLVHVKLLDLAALPEPDGAGGLGTDVEDVLRVGEEDGGASGPAGEVRDLDVPEGDRVAAEAGGGDISHLLGGHPGVLERGFEGLTGHLLEVRLGLGEPAAPDGALLIDEDALRRPRPDVDSRDQHG